MSILFAIPFAMVVGDESFCYCEATFRLQSLRPEARDHAFEVIVTLTPSFLTVFSFFMLEVPVFVVFMLMGHCYYCQD